MNTVLIILIVLFAIGAATMVVRGLITMASGKDISGAQSNKLMSLRVAFQLGAILLVVALLGLSRMNG